MNGVTVCPKCQTRFRVTEAQLQIRNGSVRCGRCEHVFNALETLIEEISPLSVEPPRPATQQTEMVEQAQEAPSTQKSQVQQDKTATPEPSDIPEPLFELEIIHPETQPAVEESRFELETTHSEKSAEDRPEFFPAVPSDDNTSAIEAVTEMISEAQAAPDLEPDMPEARVVRIQPPPSVTQPKVSPDRPKYAPPPKPKRAWPWALANLLLLTGLVGQGIYFFRDAIAAHYPLTRPLLEQACAPLECHVSLPRNPDLISIESSELHADPGRGNIVVLTSVLRNRATHVQAYPTLELTLTNTRDETVARILFPPGKYLRNPAQTPQGIPSSGEVAVKLLMDMGEIKAEGYRLYLFYPS